MPYPKLADYFALRKEELISRWRSAARADNTQPCQRLNLTDADLDGHFPALLDALIRALRNHETQSVEREGVEHGHQRRELGYNVAETLWELTLFRQMILTVVEEFEAETKNPSPGGPRGGAEAHTRRAGPQRLGVGQAVCRGARAGAGSSGGAAPGE